MKLWKKNGCSDADHSFVLPCSGRRPEPFPHMEREHWENTAQTFGRQLEAAASLMEQFWDGSQYSLMSETGKKAYREFQFRMCCGDGYALINRESGEVEGNFTGYQIVDLKADGYAGGQRRGRLPDSSGWTGRSFCFSRPCRSSRKAICSCL